ncbi:MAG TPA: hypothetical protein VNH17_06540, partial [Streptosporangiaceae bacterium]|nr:hypothetical protein [Streptosporangiaceae bacterium]
TPERVRHAPGETATAALLAAGALIERARAPRGAWIAAVPIVIINYVAFRAQLRFWQAHLDPADAILVSVALESVAVFWSWLAAQALIADDSALRPRLAAYGTALLIGTLNYSHYCRPGWRPTVAAVTFGLMSAISPWLWTAYSRRVSRPLLKAKGLIEDHSVRLGVTRWFWHAYRCLGVMWLATWEGVNKPADAIALYSARREEKRALREEKTAGTSGDRGTVALPAENVPADKTPPPARPHREPRRAVTGQREARVPGNGLAAASSPDDEARREARREAGRRAAAIRWGKQPEVTLAGPVNGNGGSHGGGS